MFNWIMKRERNALYDARAHYTLAKLNSEIALANSKTEGKKLLSSPQGLATSFAAGAIKGLTRSPEHAHKRKAMTRFARTALWQVFG